MYRGVKMFLNRVIIRVGLIVQSQAQEVHNNASGFSLVFFFFFFFFPYSYRLLFYFILSHFHLIRFYSSFILEGETARAKCDHTLPVALVAMAFNG